LRAAVAVSKLEGRQALEGDLRDAICFAVPGAERGPDGDLLAFWQTVTGAQFRGGTFPDDLQDAADLWLGQALEQARATGPR